MSKHKKRQAHHILGHEVWRIQVELLQEDIDEAVCDRRVHDDCAGVIDGTRESLAQRRVVE